MQWLKIKTMAQTKDGCKSSDHYLKLPPPGTVVVCPVAVQKETALDKDLRPFASAIQTRLTWGRDVTTEEVCRQVGARLQNSPPVDAWELALPEILSEGESEDDPDPIDAQLEDERPF